MDAQIESIKKITDKIDGWLTDMEGKFLYETAKNCKGKGVIVEIGSWKGKSTIWLAKGSIKGNNVKVFAIDTHTGSFEQQKNGPVWTFDEFKGNIRNAKVEDIVVPIVKTSEEAEKSWGGAAVEFLWIDGAHEYELVKLDFEKWFPHLIDGGIIAFHDTIVHSGPRKVVKENIFLSRNFRCVGFADNITFAQKVKKNSFKNRLRNRYILFIKGFYEFIAIYGYAFPKPIKQLCKNIIKKLNITKKLNRP
ncbi:MAG: class I SAM-dependent methyltransferase [Nanoarchaeota archaeon]|nr:class I SAM-dependent methyltransferase [Nanoarchaeota archaeon]